MNDYNDARANDAAMSSKLAEAMRYDRQSAIGGQIASARNSVGPRPAMASLGSILDRSRKLAEMANDLANRIGGPVPSMEGVGDLMLDTDPLSNLATATKAVEETLDRAEQNLARALTGL